MLRYLARFGKVGGFGVIVCLRRRSRGPGDPPVERFDTPGDVESEVNGADRYDSSRGKEVCATGGCGDGEDAEVTEGTDGYRSEGAGHGSFSD